MHSTAFQRAANMQQKSLTQVDFGQRTTQRQQIQKENRRDIVEKSSKEKIELELIQSRAICGIQIGPYAQSHAIRKISLFSARMIISKAGLVTFLKVI